MVDLFYDLDRTGLRLWLAEHLSRPSQRCVPARLICDGFFFKLISAYST
jgi:hypothetical protein